MLFFKKYLLPILGIGLVLCIASIAFIEANYDYEYANMLAQRGIIEDHSLSSGQYRLNDTISRKEMLKIMIGLSDATAEICEAVFSDISTDDWACKYATAGVQHGFIAKNATFRPDDTISKAETLKMILRARNIEVPERSDWQSAYVEVALEK